MDTYPFHNCKGSTLNGKKVLVNQVYMWAPIEKGGKIEIFRVASHDRIAIHFDHLTLSII